MQLEKKNKPIILTIICLVLYLLKSLVSGIFIGTFHANEMCAEIFSTFFVLAIVFFIIKKKEMLSYLGICKWQCDNLFKMHFLLFIVPFVNLPYLFSGAKINIVSAIFSSVFVGIMEELIFRSLLCRSIEQVSNKNKAIVISSVIFGGFHLLNIGNYPLEYVLMQVMYAFAIGIAFSVIFYKTKSILICIIIHTLVDFLGAFELEPIFIAEVIGTVICCLCAAYYYFHYMKGNKMEVKDERR